MTATPPPTSPAHLVAAFHQACGLPVRDRPGLPSDQEATQRQALIQEEAAEVGQAVAAGDLVGVARELADLVYVAYGTALVYGLDLDAVLAEVHAANMRKAQAGARVQGGKVTKPAGFVPPNVAQVLGL